MSTEAAQNVPLFWSYRGKLLAMQSQGRVKLGRVAPDGRLLYRGTVLQRAVPRLSYEGRAPRTRAEQLELTTPMAQRLMQNVRGKPIYIEHGKPAGKVAVGEIVEGSCCSETGKSDVVMAIDRRTAQGAWAAAVIENNLMRGLSLSHNASTLEPVEVSICLEGARPGTHIHANDLIEASKTATEILHEATQSQKPEVSGKMEVDDEPEPEGEAEADTEKSDVLDEFVELIRSLRRAAKEKRAAKKQEQTKEKEKEKEKKDVEAKLPEVVALKGDIGELDTSTTERLCRHCGQTGGQQRSPASVYNSATPENSHAQAVPAAVAVAQPEVSVNASMGDPASAMHAAVTGTQFGQAAAAGQTQTQFVPPPTEAQRKATHDEALMRGGITPAQPAYAQHAPAGAGAGAGAGTSAQLQGDTSGQPPPFKRHQPQSQAPPQAQAQAPMQQQQAQAPQGQSQSQPMETEENAGAAGSSEAELLQRVLTQQGSLSDEEKARLMTMIVNRDKATKEMKQALEEERKKRELAEKGSTDVVTNFSNTMVPLLNQILSRQGAAPITPQHLQNPTQMQDVIVRASSALGEQRALMQAYAQPQQPPQQKSEAMALFDTWKAMQTGFGAAPPAPVMQPQQTPRFHPQQQPQGAWSQPFPAFAQTPSQVPQAQPQAQAQAQPQAQQQQQQLWRQERPVPGAGYTGTSAQLRSASGLNPMAAAWNPSARKFAGSALIEASASSASSSADADRERAMEDAILADMARVEDSTEYYNHPSVYEV